MNDHEREDPLDRDVRAFLAWETQQVAGAPTVTEMAMRIQARTATRMASPLLAPGPAWVLLTALLIVAVAGVALIGATLLRQEAAPIGGSYEAVFLRFDEATLQHGDVLVIGVNARGAERLIARLSEANYRHGFPVPMGAVSRSGLLAMPRSANEGFHWEIVDLAAPDREPLPVAMRPQNTERLERTPYYGPGRSRPGPFWGPGERLALPVKYSVGTAGPFWHWVFANGRTGAATTAERPGGLPDGLAVVPQWAADGSGIAVEGDRTGIAGGRTVLRPDGSLGEQHSGVADGGYGRRYRSDGTELQVEQERVLAVSLDRSPDLLFSAVGGGEIADAAWTADGRGAWIIERSPDGARDLTVKLALPPAEPEKVSAVPNPPNVAAPASYMKGHLMGVSPDDSMLVLTLDRLPEDSPIAVYAGQLVAPGTGLSFRIEGTFAGWLEVAP